MNSVVWFKIGTVGITDVDESCITLFICITHQISFECGICCLFIYSPPLHTTFCFGPYFMHSILDCYSQRHEWGCSTVTQLPPSNLMSGKLERTHWKFSAESRGREERDPVTRNKNWELCKRGGKNGLNKVKWKRLCVCVCVFDVTSLAEGAWWCHCWLTCLWSFLLLDTTT